MRTDAREEEEIVPDPVLGGRFASAAGYAVELHANQARKGSRIPYLSHLLAVSSLVMEDGGDEEQVIAALLHDGPEDQGGQLVLDEIRNRFGEEVARIVHGLTDTLESPKPEWRPRKEAYLKRLEHEDESVLPVSLADKLHNLRSVAVDLAREGERVWERFNAPRDQQAWYYRSLLRVFEQRLAGSKNLPEFRGLVDEVFPPG